MNTMFLAAQAAGGQGSSMSFLFVMIAVFGIMWFFMIRPQQKKQKEVRNFQNALSEGTKVVIGGGIHGTVRRVNMAEGTVEVEIARGTNVTVDKNYVFESADASMTSK